MLEFFVKIFKDGKEIAGQDHDDLPGTDTVLVPSIFVVLQPGEYIMKIEFISSQFEVLRQPCQSV